MAAEGNVAQFPVRSLGLPETAPERVAFEEWIQAKNELHRALDKEREAKYRLLAQLNVPNERLSVREGQVMRLLRNGLQNKEIASTLGISTRTVKAHVSRLLKKFGVGSRTEFVMG